MIHEDKFVGCLIGMAIGDAVGCPLEAKPTDTCTAFVGSHLSKPDPDRIKELPKPRTGEVGQYTDDTQLARELLISLNMMDGFHPPNYAGRIRALFENNQDVGSGGTTRKAAQRLIDGASWDEAGTLPPAAGNGTAMRSAPIGLWFHDDWEGMLRASHEHSLITHKALSCSAGSAAIAAAVAYVARTWTGLAPDYKKTIYPLSFLKYVAKAARRFDAKFSRAIEKIPFKSRPHRALKEISKAGSASDKFKKWDGISSYVVPSVLWALYSFLRAPEDYWETIQISIACGGDVDSTAAMAGAISGAHLGADSLPLELAKIVNDQGTWGYDALVDLAKKAYRTSQRVA
jgi:ADP-ribosylglycohydrolase